MSDLNLANNGNLFNSFSKKDSLLFADRLAGSFILGLAQIIMTQLLLGVVFESLFALPLLILNVLLSSVVLVLALRTVDMKNMFIEIKDEVARMLGIIIGDRILFCIFGLVIVLVVWLALLGFLFPSYSWAIHPRQ